VLTYSWIVLASAVTAGLLTTLLGDSHLSVTMKALVLATTFMAWAGGIATAYLVTTHPLQPVARRRH
jgi:hypothetical protein